MVIEDAGGRIDYDESGAGPTVVLVPGSCGPGAAWRPVITGWFPALSPPKWPRRECNRPCRPNQPSSESSTAARRSLTLQNTSSAPAERK
jgi:pimeloyl-ACP methyl ester carboxylesterase